MRGYDKLVGVTWGVEAPWFKVLKGSAGRVEESWGKMVKAKIAEGYGYDAACRLAKLADERVTEHKLHKELRESVKEHVEDNTNTHKRLKRECMR